MDTLRIAICEDNPQDAERLRRLITEAQVCSTVRIFSDGETLLRAFTPGFFHLILLDIYLDDMASATGLDLAKEIRLTDEEVRLAFTTTSREHALAGFGVNASQYLVKPVQPVDIQALLRATEKFFDHQNDSLSVVADRQKVDIPIHSILYIEVFNKQCVIHTVNQKISLFTSLSELENSLPSPPFLRCHRSFLVNMDHIETMDRDFTVSNGDTVQIRRADYWKMKRAYRDYVITLARTVSL
jgi:DNA-binding LytR/AlgR family response regulator